MYLIQSGNASVVSFSGRYIYIKKKLKTHRRFKRTLALIREYFALSEKT